VNAAIDRDFDAHLERIRDFLRIPSVSAADGDLRPAAAAVCELIEAAGGTAAIAEPGERRPTVIGVIDGPGPTVLRYGMYDVQPPGAGWTRDPFAAEVDRGRIYARGAANSKAALAGGLLAFAGADSPCRQVLLMDGEEELGSPRLADFCAAHRDDLRADWALDFDMHEAEDGSAPVVAGCKGLYELELRAGDGVDVHSSLVGSVPAPASDLARAILALQAAIPAANVTWMIAGTPEDVSRTVVPGSARAGVDLRFDTGGDALLARAREVLPPEVELVVKGTYEPASAPVDSPPVQAMARVMERLGTAPRIAAQAPWWGPYHLYGVPFASGGLGRSAGAHGPDEWCEVDGLRRFMHMAHDTVAELAAAS
jgi:acetylornithine deacetylase/succinyl-diaminopimelate desuccinylase-like protein